ncbi:MAG: hypothetical protein ABH871_05860, partial [Pseudomonadota bacterium]
MVFIGRPAGTLIPGTGVGPLTRMTAAMSGVYERCSDTTRYSPFAGARGPVFARGPSFWAKGGGALSKPQEHVLVADALNAHSELFSELTQPTRELVARGFLQAYGKHVHRDRRLIDDNRFETMISRYWHCLMLIPLNGNAPIIDDDYNDYSEMAIGSNYSEYSVEDFMKFGATHLADADDHIKNAIDEITELRHQYLSARRKTSLYLSGEALNEIIVKTLRLDFYYLLFGESQLERIATATAKSLLSAMEYEWEIQKIL